MQYLKVRPLSTHLDDWRTKIEGIAGGLGLDFFETRFEVVSYDKMSEIAAFGGFPTRYPHWRFGMEFERLSKSHTYGLSKIYELVINNNPCYAYLLEGNEDVDQKLVMAHVFGHCDFFKNNFGLGVLTGECWTRWQIMQRGFAGTRICTASLQLSNL